MKTDTLPSIRLATSASVPDGLIATPDAPAPVSCVPITVGGDARRSITLTMWSGTSFFLSAGSIFVAAVTSANDSSRAIATLDGGPTRLAGIWISAVTLGGDAARLMIVTESGTGLSGTVFTPLINTALPSLAEISRSARAPACIPISNKAARGAVHRK